MLKMIFAFALVSTVAMADDSPLVALAKRSNRQASKTPVITNETLAKVSGGRVSFAAGEAPAMVSVAPGAAAKAQQETKTADSAPTRDAAAATASTATQAIPAFSSNVRNIDLPTTVQNTPMVSTAGNSNLAPVSSSAPQSTAGTIQPQSTVQNTAPQASSYRP